MKISEQREILQRQLDEYGDINIEDIPELILDAKILTFKELKVLIEESKSYGEVEVKEFLDNVRYFLNYTKENNNDK